MQTACAAAVVPDGMQQWEKLSQVITAKRMVIENGQRKTAL